MKIHRIRSTLIQAFTLVIMLIIIVLGTFSLYVSQQTLAQNSQRSTEQIIAQLNRVFDSYIGYMDDIALVVLGNGDTRELVASDSPQPDLEHKVSSFLQSIRTVRRDIDSIFLLLDKSRIITSNPERKVNPWLSKSRLAWYQPLVAPGKSSVISAARVENLFADRYSWVVSLVREIHDHSPDGAVASGSPVRGIVQVNLNYAIINDLCRQIQLGNSGYVFIVNDKGEIVYHPRQQLIYSGLRSERIDRILAMRNGNVQIRVGDREVMYTAITSEGTGWTIVAVTYQDELFYNSRDIEYIYLMIAVASFLLTVFIAWMVSLKLSKPIEELRRTMQVVETGNFDLDITVNAKNEIFELARDCDIAIKKIRDLVAQGHREQELKRKQALLMLQSQINPHFLYNTLDSIIWLIELNQNQDAIDMTSALARFFRLGISKGSEIISIKNEVEHIRFYLIIQKMRYKSKLEFELNIDQEIENCRCLKLLLQPLVENAIYHGIKNRQEGGLIRVEGFRINDTLVLRVRDNGVGMDAETLRRANSNTADDNESENHIGLFNVQERIRLYFGEPYGLHFDSILGEGTVVTITLPIMEGGDSQ